MLNWIKKEWKRALAWVDYRTGLRVLIKTQLSEYRLPPKLHFWYSLGGLSLFLFFFQVITGILLMVYYIPHSAAAFESIQRIMVEIPYGWLVRSSHATGSHLMIVVVGLHMISVVLMGTYKKPRELTWLTGCALMFSTLAVCFTGYLLPWSQLSYWATTVATAIPGSVPLAGPYLVELIRGAAKVDAETLNRFFALHVVVIPAVLLAFIGMHLLLVRILGISDPRDRQPTKPQETQEENAPETKIP